MERNLLCFLLRRVKGLSCHFGISLRNCFLIISPGNGGTESQAIPFSASMRLLCTSAVPSWCSHPTSRKSRVLIVSGQVQPGGKETLSVLTMNQKRREGATRHLCQVRATRRRAPVQPTLQGQATTTRPRSHTTVSTSTQPG